LSQKERLDVADESATSPKLWPPDEGRPFFFRTVPDADLDKEQA